MGQSDIQIVFTCLLLAQKVSLPAKVAMCIANLSSKLVKYFQILKLKDRH